MLCIQHFLFPSNLSLSTKPDRQVLLINTIHRLPMQEFMNFKIFINLSSNVLTNKYTSPISSFTDSELFLHSKLTVAIVGVNFNVTAPRLLIFHPEITWEAKSQSVLNNILEQSLLSQNDYFVVALCFFALCSSLFIWKKDVFAHRLVRKCVKLL